MSGDIRQMDSSTASAIAQRAHRDQNDRFGAPMFDHLKRVASTVPPDAQAVAWLHDIREWTDTSVAALRSAGLTAVEEGALDLLTRRDGEPYEEYALRVAFGRGEAGKIARIVKHADLDDHIATAPSDADAPPYAWARRHIQIAEWQFSGPRPLAR
jgi:hypothetical protein